MKGFTNRISFFFVLALYEVEAYTCNILRQAKLCSQSYDNSPYENEKPKI